MICKECPHKREYRKYGNSTKEVMCKHPDRDYIHRYFIIHNIRKFEGFIGYVNSKGIFPIKKSPAWCPLKQKGGVTDTNVGSKTEKGGEV